MYQINREQVLYDWLATQTDDDKRRAMLDFMTHLAERPAEVGIRLPGSRKPVYLAVTPVDDWTLRYMVVEQFRTIVLAGFERLPSGH